MRKIAFAALLIFIFAPSALSIRQDGAWSRFTSAEGGFSVLLPGAPAPSTVKNASGRERREFTLEHGAQLYRIIYTDFPDMPSTATAADVFRAFRAGLMREPTMQILKTTELRLKGFTGQELRTEAHGKAGIIRLYLVGIRLYQVGAFFPANQVDEKALTKFFSSFELVQAR